MFTCNQLFLDYHSTRYSFLMMKQTLILVDTSQCQLSVLLDSSPLLVLDTWTQPVSCILPKLNHCMMSQILSVELQ